MRLAYAAALVRLAIVAPALLAQQDAHDHAAVSGPVRQGTVISDTLANEIRFALLPLPEQLRSAATVMRMDSARAPVLLRQGAGGMVCTHFVHGEDAWDARCYEPSMARVILRVRALVRAGVKPDSIDSYIRREIRAGNLALPLSPTAGYRVLGPLDSYDPTTGTATPRLASWQSLHVPFATARAMGLPDISIISDAQRRLVPYVMASGTWWAHVMIEHP